MAAADNISTLDNAAFARLKANAANSKARQLIHSDAIQDSKVIKERQKDRNRIIDKTNNGIPGVPEANLVSSSSSNRVNEEIGSMGVEYDRQLDERMAALQKSVYNQTMGGGNLGLTQSSTANNNMPHASEFLPKEIVEAFKKNPIDVEPLNPNRSVLDTIGVTDGYQNVNEEKEQPQHNTAAAIDYKMIKSIIEATVKKYAVALNKRMLNESKGGDNMLQAMKIGNKFSFIDGHGNIYEATLKKVGNVRGKK